MQPLEAFPVEARRRIRGVLCDIDDTLTTDGRLTAEAYGALEALHEAGFLVAPVTGRPAGWCDHIARMWPVDGVVGENGAFYFRYRRRGHWHPVLRLGQPVRLAGGVADAAGGVRGGGVQRVRLGRRPPVPLGMSPLPRIGTGNASFFNYSCDSVSCNVNYCSIRARGMEYMRTAGGLMAISIEARATIVIPNTGAYEFVLMTGDVPPSQGRRL